MRFDTLIRGGRVLDGTGAKWRPGLFGIFTGRITLGLPVGNPLYEAVVNRSGPGRIAYEHTARSFAASDLQEQ